MSKLTHEAALEKFKQAAGDVVEVLYACDPDDPVSSVMHHAKELRDALSILSILDGTAEDILDDEDDDPDLPPECDLCEGQGFGADAEGAVACPQCNGTGVWPPEE